MRKYLFGFWIVALSLLMLSITFTTVKAEDKTSAIIGHVITQAIQGNDMDHGEVLGNELAALMHKFSIEMTTVLLRNMPNILDNVAAQIRIEADKQYKCSIQGKDYKNKECI